jgi:hypothetical protein
MKKGKPKKIADKVRFSNKKVKKDVKKDVDVIVDEIADDNSSVYLSQEAGSTRAGKSSKANGGSSQGGGKKSNTVIQ